MCADQNAWYLRQALRIRPTPCTLLIIHPKCMLACAYFTPDLLDAAY